MFKNCSSFFSALIPRESWDPLHHNPKWVDSYAEPIAVRREWPARQWLVGLNPKSPREFLSHSMRNLAYEYNASLRACSTFPEMIPFYKEMMIRGVKMDVDTMYIVLSRASRCPAVSTKQIFALWDEMLQHGARPDLATTEVLQTVLSVSGKDPMREETTHQRREELVGMYSALCIIEMQRLGARKQFSLLQQVFHRCRQNATLLKSMLSYKCYATYVSYIVKDCERVDTLSYPRNIADKSDTTFMASPALTHTAEGVLLALRYDIGRCFASSDHVMRLTKESEIDCPSKGIYLYSLKKLFQDKSLHNDIQQGIATVYLSALQSSILRYGTSDAIDVKRLLYFCRLLWMDISLNELVHGTKELFETIMEVYRFYGKSQAARTAVEYIWTKNIMTPKIISHFTASVDPWDQERSFIPFQLTGGRFAFHRRNAANAVQNSIENHPGRKNMVNHIEGVYTAAELEKRYREIKKFVHEGLSNEKCRCTAAEFLSIPTALLWFLRKALDVVLLKEAKNITVFSAAWKCLEDIEHTRITLISRNDVTVGAFRQDPNRKNDIEMTKVALRAIPSDIAGDYADMFFHLSELITLNAEEDTIKNVIKLRSRFMETVQNDERLLLTWMEES